MERARDILASWRSAAAPPVRATLAAAFRFRIVGQQHLPRERFVLIANHASHLDVLCLLAALPTQRLRHAHPAAARDYFSAGLPRLAARLVNAVPFERDAGTRRGLSACRRVLETPGGVLILFPEGTRTTTGTVRTFRPGVGALLAGTDIPVVPCALAGTFQAWPKGAAFPHPGRVQLVIGEPRHYATWPRGHHANHAIAADLQTSVAALLQVANDLRDSHRILGTRELPAGQPA